MTETRSVIQERLEKFRKKLLDTSRRNKLVNFRSHSINGNKPIEKVVVVEGEDPIKVLMTLVQGQTPKAMSFLGLPEPQNGVLDLESSLIKDDDELDVDQDDDKLSTRLTKTRLERHLTKIRRDQIEMIEEQGINALYLALGQLKWFEAEHSRESRLAPLVLIPVLLDRTDRGGFKLRWDGTELGSNLSLAILLRDEFSIDLPLIEGEDLDLAKYLKEIAKAVSIKLDWSVDPNAITLGFFSFAKQLIYKDLAPESWPEGRNILTHETLGSLLVNGFAESESTLTEESYLDELRPVGDTNEVFDADGSQTLAILQAMGGQSMVIEGPPGTGKSQTIANLIAEFVGQGKKVLFVSEKSAALNVVFDRMRTANLDSACLELHGTKAKKAAFYHNLKDTMSRREPRLADVQNSLRQLGIQRENLNGYVHDLHSIDKRGATPREAFGKLILLGGEKDLEGRINKEAFAQWTMTDFLDAKEAVQNLQNHLQRIGYPKEHPFFGSSRAYISPDDKSELGRNIEATYLAFKSFWSEVQKQTEFICLDVPSDLSDVSSLESSIEFIIQSPSCEHVNFGDEGWLTKSEEIRRNIQVAIELKAIHDQFDQNLREEAWAYPVERLLRNLLPPGITEKDDRSGQLWESIDIAERSTREVTKLASHICHCLSMPIPPALWAMDSVAEIATLVSSGPSCRELNTESELWRTDFDQIKSTIESSKLAFQVQRDAKTAVKSSSWNEEVSELCTVIERDGGNFIKRIFSNEFKAARKKATALVTNPEMKLHEVLASVRSIGKFQKAIIQAKPGIPTVKNLFGSTWKDQETDFDLMEKSLIFLGQLHNEIARSRLKLESLRTLQQPQLLKQLGEWSAQMRTASSKCASSILLLNEQIEGLRGPDAMSQTGDPIERTFRYLVDSVSPLRVEGQELWNGTGDVPSLRQIVRGLGMVRQAQVKADLLQGSENTMVKALGDHWVKRSECLSDLPRLVEWVISFKKSLEAKEFPIGLLSFFKECRNKGILTGSLANLQILRREYSNLLTKVSDQAELQGGPEEFLAQPISYQESKILGWQKHVSRIEDYFRFNWLCDGCEKLGLKQVSDLSLNWQKAQERLLIEFERSWWNLIVEEAILEKPRLREFDRQTHEEMLGKFRAHDRLLIQHNRAKVEASHWQNVPRGNAVGEMGFLNIQMAKQRGHRSIRHAMREAYSAIQTIKPVFLMSPMSVAMYLPPEGPLFDVVIFDEASQIKPEDALGSVIRAKQMIVVGDTKQMPPTSIFDRLTSSDDQSEDEDEDMEGNDLAEQESILAFASSRIPDGSSSRRDLRWHYRSRHEDLIRTSNRLFYRDRLVIFPHPKKSDSEMGLIFRYVPDTVYDRGNTRKNILEAREVARAARDHVIQCPGLTLGIVAFSKAQQEAIEDEIDLLRRAEPAFYEFDNNHGLDRLFVKNLESVQGDERDVIMISVGYGRDENNFLSLSFGPLNKEGGERRLNVLITRAKLRSVVFSNFKAAELRIAETNSKGIAALHTFMTFAESGHLDVATSRPMPEPSYFEEAVFEKLSSRGYHVEKQIGSEGFFIDLAVRDPNFPGRYAIGIECDGAMYHSAKTARDRDRLRQQVLEDRGWTIHRIWSTDWWRHPQQELERCCEAIERSFLFANNGVKDSDLFCLEDAEVIPAEENCSHDSEMEVDSTNQVQSPAEQTNYYVCAEITWPPDLEILDCANRPLAQLVGQIANIESPIHLEEIVRRIREGANKGRAGHLIRNKIEFAVRLAVEDGLVSRRGDFIYSGDAADYVVRDRSQFPPQSKKIELISPEEILAAAMIVLKESIAVPAMEFGKPVSRMFGFKSVSASMEEYVNDVVANFCDSGELVVAQGKVRISPP